jgi:phosphatidate cytidylyltransferase
MSEQGSKPLPRFDDLKNRVTAAIGLAAVSLFALWFGSWVLAIYLALLVCIMMMEMNAMCQHHGSLCASGGLVAIVGAVAAVLLGAISPLYAMMAMLPTLGTIWWLNDRKLDWRPIIGMAMIVFGALAVYHLREREGVGTVVWLVACVVAADTGGYFFGRKLGGPKLWTKISPKKTWSGFVGGVILSIICTAIFALLLDGQMGSFIFLGILIAVFALIGDLLESAAKRFYGVKDSGTILPGHGGLLDRFDGLSLVVIVFWVMSSIGLINMTQLYTSLPL